MAWPNRPSNAPSPRPPSTASNSKSPNSTPTPPTPKSYAPACSRNVGNTNSDRARSLADKYSNDLQLRFDLGLLYFKSQRWNEAIQEFQKAQNSPHKRIQSLNYLGQCFTRRGLHDLAVRAFQSAIREKETFDDEKKELIYELGDALEKAGKANEAIEQFKLIYEVDIGYRDVAAKIDQFYSKG